MRCIVLILLFVAWAGRGFAESPLTLDLATHREFYPAYSQHKVYAEALIGDGAPTAADPASVRNVVFVIDRSGSMAGERMQGVSAGLVAALAQLNDKDLVSVVVFGSEVETLLEAQPRASITDPAALLARVEPSGGTALYDALNQGAALLRRHTGPAVSSQLVLVTDGPPSKGPRELADFVRLAGVFADERIVMSAIGLGDEFNEDLLVALARAGNGRFYYVLQPAKLAEILPAAVATPGPLVASDVVLTVEILADCRDLETYRWQPTTVGERSITYRLPYIFAGQKPSLFFGVEIEARRSLSYRFAKLKLAWTGVDGVRHETEKVGEVRLEADQDAVARSQNPAVLLTAVRTVISDGLQKAIEQIDKGDFKKALRALRSARSDAYAFNFKVDDPEVEAAIHRFEAYLNEVQARGVALPDRKVLRSGLFNQFGIPVADDKPLDP